MTNEGIKANKLLCQKVVFCSLTFAEAFAYPFSDFGKNSSVPLKTFMATASHISLTPH